MGSLAHIDLNLLLTMRTFVDVGTVAAAGRVLGRSQPAISARLHQLEHDLGVQLFERQGRRLQLTPIGRAVDADARELVAGIQRIVDRAQTAATQPAGVVRVGALPTVGVHVLTEVIASFSRRHEGVQLELHYGAGAGHARDLVAGKLDLVASVGRPPTEEGLDVHVLRQVTAVLVAPASEVPALPDPCTVADLAVGPFIGYGRVGDAFFDEVWDFVERNGLHTAARIVSPHISTLKALVAAGAGVTVLPDYTVVEPDLVSRSLEGLSVSQPMWVATRSSSACVPAIAALVADLLA